MVCVVCIFVCVVCVVCIFVCVLCVVCFSFHTKRKGQTYHRVTGGDRNTLPNKLQCGEAQCNRLLCRRPEEGALHELEGVEVDGHLVELFDVCFYVEVTHDLEMIGMIGDDWRWWR